jgi:predicted dinucleotide-binding enzyme
MSHPSHAHLQTVAILGTGNVGVSLAKGFTAMGLRVVFGTRDVNGTKVKEALAAVPGTTAATLAEAAKTGDIAVIAVPWGGLKDALEGAGTANFAGKLVIDVTNPLEFSTGAPRLAIGFGDSSGETVQRLLPAAKVVKAFNHIGASVMVQPKYATGTPDMLIAGNDDAAKRDVGRILEAFGWRRPIDLGDITASRLLEPLAMTWIAYALRTDHWTHGFSLLGQK